MKELNRVTLTSRLVALVVEGESVIADQILKMWEAVHGASTNPDEWDGAAFRHVTYEEFLGEKDWIYDLAVVVSDAVSPEFERKALQECRDRGLKVLFVQGRGSAILIGPLERPEHPGCTTCLQLRWDHSVLRTRLRETLRSGPSNTEHFLAQLGMDPAEIERLSVIVVDEIAALFVRGVCHAEGHVGMVRRDGMVEWIPLLPSHECPRCRLRPMDDARFGQVEFQSHFIRELDSLRTQSIKGDQLRRLYVHRDVGYVSSIQDYGFEGYARASAHVQTPFGTTHVGHGSGFTVNEARQKAVLEVIERLCAVRATNRTPVVFASYLEVRDHAVDPRRFGLHDDSFFQHASNYFEPYNDDKRYSWIWAYSTKRRMPVLIPEQIAYYGMTRDAKRFVKDSSSGCALGSTMEEAVLFGIFEVLERDGFLNMWYGKLPVPELMLGSHCPSEVRHLHKLIADCDYDVRFFDLSHDLDIPNILAVGIRVGGTGPTVVCGSSCHLNPYEATSGALRELMVQIQHLDSISEDRRQEGREMLRNPSRIRDILDHVVAASLPEAYPRWSFLLHGQTGRKVQAVEATCAGWQRHQAPKRDIRIVLESVLADLHQRGFDVIVVDQTNVEAATGGLLAAKAIIPGMTPITFGFGSERITGLKRVFELPYQLGYSQRVLTRSDINQDCHPFS